MTARNLIEAEITKSILANLEDDNQHPFRKLWDEKGMIRSKPYNIQSDAYYRGANFFLLSQSGYNDPRWLTFNQARLQKAQVKKGEKASVVFFYSETSTTTLSAKAAKEETEDGQEFKRRFVIKRYYVFNATQCEGLPPLVAHQERSWEPSTKAEELIQALNPKIEHHDISRAYYNVKEDKIFLPNQGHFKTKEDYYSVLLHEVAHWTGASHRLNRSFGMKGSPEYAREELVAELSSVYLGAEIGINYDMKNNVAYLKSWHKIIKDDQSVVYDSIRQAQKVLDYVMPSREKEKEKTQEQAKGPELVLEEQKNEKGPASYVLPPARAKEEKQFAR